MDRSAHADDSAGHRVSARRHLCMARWHSGADAFAMAQHAAMSTEETSMQASPELRDAVMRSAQDFFVAKNIAAALDSYSREPGVLVLGTAPTEWFEGIAAAEGMLRASMEGGSGNMPPDLQLQAWQEGTVGWAAYQWTGRLPNGSTFKLRGTEVLHLEGGNWKMVQQHVSVGIPDELVPSIAQ
jgi:hypothetical protein